MGHFQNVRKCASGIRFDRDGLVIQMKYNEIKNLFDKLDDPVLRLELVIDLGRELANIPSDSDCTEISGCASHAAICKSRGIFYGQSDSAMVRGIIAICISMANDGVKDIRTEFESLNINLGAGRLAGLDGIIKTIGN